MKTRSFKNLVLGILAGSLLSVAAYASPTLFSNRALFESVLSGETIITFEGNHPNYWTDFSDTGVTIGDVAFSGPTSYGFPYLYIGESSVNPYGTSYGLNTGDFLLGEGRGSIVMTSLGGGFSAMGFDFSLSEMSSNTLVSYAVTLSDGNVFTGQVFSGQKQFFGVILDSTVASISFANGTGMRPPQLIIDNVTYVTGPSQVPDTGSTAGLLLVSLLALAAPRRSALRW